MAGHRRAILEAGGALLGTCAFLGPRRAGVDILLPGGGVAARVRGGTMAVRDYHARLEGGEALRVLGEPPRLEVLSDRRAATSLSVEGGGDGGRVLAWERDGGILGVLRTGPGPATWSLEAPDREDPIRSLAVLLAAELLLREAGAAEGDQAPSR